MHEDSHRILGLSYYDLRDSLAQPACALCRLIARCSDRYLDGLLWEFVNDVGVRRNIRLARGFCKEHYWGLVRYGASLGVAIISLDVLTAVLKVMREGEFRATPWWSLHPQIDSLKGKYPTSATAELVSRLSSQAKCPACAHIDVMEEIYLDTLLDNLLGEDGLLEAYRNSDGLCLPHFRQALARVRDRAVFEALMGAQQTIWQRLAEHLKESIRKSDYRFHDEPRGEESGSWLRAIAALAGAKSEKS